MSREQDQKLVEAYERIVKGKSSLKEAKNPLNETKDPSGEKAGFIEMVHRRAVELMTYKLISKQDVDKIDKCMKNVIRI